MEIYRVTSDQIEPAYFEHFKLIEDTLRVSYSSCKNVDIVKSPSAFGPIIFTVTGMIARGQGRAEAFKHSFEISRIVVLTNTTHL